MNYRSSSNWCHPVSKDQGGHSQNGQLEALNKTPVTNGLCFSGHNIFYTKKIKTEIYSLYKELRPIKSHASGAICSSVSYPKSLS